MTDTSLDSHEGLNLTQIENTSCSSSHESIHSIQQDSPRDAPGEQAPADHAPADHAPTENVSTDHAPKDHAHSDHAPTDHSSDSAPEEFADDGDS